MRKDSAGLPVTKRLADPDSMTLACVMGMHQLCTFKAVVKYHRVFLAVKTGLSRRVLI